MALHVTQHAYPLTQPVPAVPHTLTTSANRAITPRCPGDSPHDLAIDGKPLTH